MRQKRLTKKQGDMVLANRGLMWDICHRMNVHLDDIEDVIEDACLPGLIRAAQRFDPTRGAKFSTFAFAVIRGEILTWWRNKRRELSRNRQIKTSLRAGHIVWYPPPLHHKDECEVLLSRLGQDGRMLIKRRYWDHMTFRELAKIYHVSPQTMRNRITRHLMTMRG